MHAREVPSRGPTLLLALFHPDCDRRLRNLTGSADPQGETLRRSRASAFRPLPPVGNFTPP